MWIGEPTTPLTMHRHLYSQNSALSVRYPTEPLPSLNAPNIDGEVYRMTLLKCASGAQRVASTFAARSILCNRFIRIHKDATS